MDSNNVGCHGPPLFSTRWGEQCCSLDRPLWPKIFLDLDARYERAYIMGVLIPPGVFNQLAAMPRADARRLVDRLEKVADEPEKSHPNVVPLVGETGVFRVRQGNWRAVFSIEEGDVIVDRVAHRREVYR